MGDRMNSWCTSLLVLVLVFMLSDFSDLHYPLYLYLLNSILAFALTLTLTLDLALALGLSLSLSLTLTNSILVFVTQLSDH